MNLLPAVKHEGKIFTGDKRDTHDGILEAHSLPTTSTHGFTPDGKLWLSRKQALGWMKRYEPKTYEALGDVPDEGLHSHIYAAAKGIKQRTVSSMVDLSNKTCLVYGRRGLYLFLAQKLGEKFKKVWYYMAESAAYPCSRFKDIGTGLPEIERVYSFWKYVDKADMIFFPDVYDGDLQHYLRQTGHRVFGSGLSEKMELDKDFFLQTLHDAGLPVSYTKRLVGLDATAEYLKGKGPKWLKTVYRDDFETMKYPGNIVEFEGRLADVHHRIGDHASKTIEIFVQNVLKKKAEGGYDGFCVNGKFTKNAMVGYEIKDRGLIGKVFFDTPENINKINQAIAPLCEKFGYNGHLSTEIIFAEDGKGYFIDFTARCPCPPGEAMCQHITNYAEVVWLCAGGILPDVQWDNPFIAELTLRSPWHENHELVVDFPKSLAKHIKLKNHLGHNGKYKCIESGNGSNFGAITASGKTWKEAAEKVMEISKEITASELERDPTLFDEAQEQIEAGLEFGINF